MISVVIPVYRNAANIEPLLEALEQLGHELHGDLEVVFVVDGSPDDSYLLLSQKLPGASFRSQLLGLSRNFGSFAAIRAGLEAARGEYFAVIAADLQEPPSLVADIHEKLRSGEYDVAIGQRTSRADPGLTKLSSSIFWRTYRRLIQPDIPPGGVDVFGCNARVRDQLMRLRENNSSLVGLLFWVGFRRALVPYERTARTIGRSSWTLAKKMRYLNDSVYSFSDLPIKLLLGIGFLGLGLSLVFACVVLAGKLMGLIEVPGYAATVLLVTFFSALNLIALGVIGVYVWRTFENTKDRPGYIVAVHEQFGPGGKAGVRDA